MKESPTALISVYNKTGIAPFAKALHAAGYELLASEGTGKVLSQHCITYTSAETASQNPKGLEDCIKTLSYQLAAGILFDRNNVDHVAKVSELGIPSIDVVVCNFVNFDQVIHDPTDFNIRNIDVGGPLMVRAAATNYRQVLVVVDQKDYSRVAKAITNKQVTIKLRQELALKAFSATLAYDQKITHFLGKQQYNG